MADSVDFKITGDASQVLASLEKIVGKMDDVANATKRVSAESVKTRKASEETNSIFSGIAGFAGKFLTLAAAVGVARSAINDMNASAESSQQRLNGSVDAMGKLLQVSKGSADFKALQGKATGLVKKEGMTPEAALGLVTASRNVGKEDQAGFYGSLSQFANPELMMNTVAGLQGSFGKRAGTDQQVVDKLLKAGSLSSVPVEDLAQAAMPVSASMKSIGGTESESLSSIGVLAKSFGVGAAGSAKAGTSLKAFTDAAAKEALRKGKKLTGMESAVDMFAGMSEKQRAKAMESTEARSFYSEYQQQRSAITAGAGAINQAAALTGTAGSETAGKLAAAGASPELLSNRLKRQSEQGLAEANTGKGQKRNLTDAMIANMQQRQAEMGGDGFDKTITGWTMRGMQRLGVTSPKAYANVASMATPETAGSGAQFLQSSKADPQMQAITAALNQLTAATKANTDATKGNTTSTAAGAKIPPRNGGSE